MWCLPGVPRDSDRRDRLCQGFQIHPVSKRWVSRTGWHAACVRRPVPDVRLRDHSSVRGRNLCLGKRTRARRSFGPLDWRSVAKTATGRKSAVERPESRGKDGEFDGSFSTSSCQRQDPNSKTGRFCLTTAGDFDFCPRPDKVRVDLARTCP